MELATSINNIESNCWKAGVTPNIRKNSVYIPRYVRL